MGLIYLIREEEKPSVVIHGTPYRLVLGPFHSEEESEEEAKKFGMSRWIRVVVWDELSLEIVMEL